MQISPEHRLIFNANLFVLKPLVVPGAGGSAGFDPARLLRCDALTCRLGRRG